MTPGQIVQCALDGCEGFFTPHIYRPDQKYCGKPCQLVAAGRKKADSRKVYRPLPEHGCTHCGQGLLGRPPGGPQERYCSDKCRIEEAMDRQATALVEPLKNPYEARCLQCSDCAGEWLLTAERYSQLALAGWIPDDRGGWRTAKCLRCSGSLILDPTDRGSISSPTHGHKAQHPNAQRWLRTDTVTAA